MNVRTPGTRIPFLLDLLPPNSQVSRALRSTARIAIHVRLACVYPSARKSVRVAFDSRSTGRHIPATRLVASSRWSYRAFEQVLREAH